jgi:hypothetical protein
MKFDMDKSRDIGILAFIMIVFTLVVLLVASFGMKLYIAHGIVNNSSSGITIITNSNSTTAIGHYSNGSLENVTIDYNDPNIITLVHDNDTN